MKKELEEKLDRAKVMILNDSGYVFSAVHTCEIDIEEGGVVSRYEEGKIHLDKEFLENATDDEICDALYHCGECKIDGKENYEPRKLTEEEVEAIKDLLRREGWLEDDGEKCSKKDTDGS